MLALFFACGSMVLLIQWFIVFALYERKNDKQKDQAPLCRRQNTPTA
jgi:hypothetical protein